RDEQEMTQVEEARLSALEQHSRQALVEVLQQLIAAEAQDVPEKESPTESPTAPSVREEVIKPDKLALTKTLKIDQSRIDRLMDLIGELVVAKNSLSYLARKAEKDYGVRDLAREIKGQYTTLDHISEELQRSIMQVRMLPLSTILQKLPRVVRDLANEQDKQVDLVLEGEETEADKNIIELLSEPLIHLIRNSIGHGIEPADVRNSLEKPLVGRLTIRARQESDDLFLEISDDGRGIDPETVRRKVLTMGLADEEKLADMDPHDIIQYIFAAGFSTAEHVSGLSGRGVGMDVVRSSVEHLGGKVQVRSRLGQGTTTTLTLPLSISVSKVMTFTLCGQALGIPIN
ncbi:MAG: chemotaxis protein CheA, partial [Candidatus Electrothrix sp. AUS4]|nr:chemotaxis protein CheA [Candidatus Electrothrix sp. AUS4]